MLFCFITARFKNFGNLLKHKNPVSAVYEAFELMDNENSYLKLIKPGN